MKTTRLQRLLVRAARTIEVEAEELRGSCYGYNTETDWACSDCNEKLCSSRKRYIDMMAVANKLRAEALTIAKSKPLA